MNSTYLLLDLFTISIPLLRSFEPRIGYSKKWKFLFPAITIVAAIFLVWDYLFTSWGIWSFNHDYVMGPFIAGMPIEEWGFFFAIPFACVFIYEAVHYFFDLEKWEPYARKFLGIVAVVLLFIGIFQWERLYSSVTFISTGMYLIFMLLVLKPKYLAYFLVGYVLAFIPFLIVNGVLTSLPVVSYNDAENLGIRLGTIPLEDAVYMLLLLVMNVSIYEVMKNNSSIMTFRSRL